MSTKYQFKEGDYVIVDGSGQRDIVLQHLFNRGYVVDTKHLDDDDNIINFNEFDVFDTFRVVHGPGDKPRGEIPINDFIALVDGKLPPEWCIECTDKSARDKGWAKLMSALPSFHCQERGLFYGMKKSGPYFCQVRFGSEIQFSTWLAIHELNEHEPTLEESIAEMKQSDISTHICKHCGAEVDNYSSDEDCYKAPIKENDVDVFDPQKPFEVEIGENDWVKRPNSFYVGTNREGNYVVQIPGDGYYSYSNIRNVVKPELSEGQPVWFKQFEDMAIWEFGFYKDGDVDIQHSGTSFKPQMIRPLFVDGVAQYPPFND
jgi:hypothetical protein